jgi:hypothetical protein
VGLRSRLFGLVVLTLLPVAGLAATAWWAGWLTIVLEPVPFPAAGMAIFGAVILVGLVIWVGGERFVLGPVRSLVERARETAATIQGGPPRTGTRHGRGDLAALGRTLDEVAQAAEGLKGEMARTESSFRAAEARATSFHDVATDAVIGVTEGGGIVLFNRGAERIFGYAAREVLRQPLELILPTTDFPGRGRRPPLRDLAASTKRWELPGWRKGGSLFPAEVAVSRGAPNGAAAFLLVVRDVSDAKRADETLRTSEALFRGVFEHSAAGMALQRPDGSFVRVNRALCEMLGYTEPELLQLSHQSIREPEENEEPDWWSRALLSGSIRWYQGELRYRHKSGHVVWGLVGVSLVPGADRTSRDFLVQVYDITERKRAESLEAQLRQAQKVEAVGRLAAGVAHDFNNLLTVMAGRSHILLHRLPAGDALRRHVELIQSTADRAGRLTRQLLAFSRPQTIEPRVLDLNAVVSGMVPMLRRLIGEPIDLVTLLTPGLGGVTADPAQIEQVILNLVVNARDAMPEGGRLTLETANRELDAEFVQAHPGAKPGLHVALVVRDTGTGMDATTQAKLFEPFFTTKAPGKGSGIGLATVYGIVKQSGGYIAVDSELGKGATFAVYLPWIPPAELEAAAAGGMPPLAEIARGTETILLVEDEEAVRDLAREILSEAGYTVLGARHGGDALLLGDQHPDPIDLLVTDVIMPDLGGRQLADLLAATRPNLPVIFMSGYTDDAIEAHGVAPTTRTLLRKPLTPDTLLRKVREVLDARPR